MSELERILIIFLTFFLIMAAIVLSSKRKTETERLNYKAETRYVSVDSVNHFIYNGTLMHPTVCNCKK